jgi:hypothetical protein
MNRVRANGPGDDGECDDGCEHIECAYIVRLEQWRCDRTDRMATVLCDALDEIERLKSKLWRPLSHVEMIDALAEGAAESRMAQGDNAWTTIVKQRDEARAEVDRMRPVVEAACARVDNVRDRETPAWRSRSALGDINAQLVEAVDAYRKGEP